MGYNFSQIIKKSKQLTNIKFKIYTNISYNVATYETPWQAEFWKQVLFIGRLRVDKKGKKKKKKLPQQLQD